MLCNFEWEEIPFLLETVQFLSILRGTNYKIYDCRLFRSIAASTENVKEIHVELQSFKQNVEDFRIELPAELQTLVRSVHNFFPKGSNFRKSPSTTN